jgi:hypothetical protein
MSNSRYFNANDKNNLRVIASNSNEYNLIFLYSLSGVTGCCGAGIGVSAFVVSKFCCNSQILNAIGSKSALYAVVYLSGVISGITSFLSSYYCGFVAKDIYETINTRKISYQINDSDTKAE